MLKISVTNRAAFCCGDKDPITSGSVGYPVEFLFSNDWDGLQKIAVFRGSGLAFDVPLINTDSTVIPHEVLTQPGKPLRIGVYGANGDGDVVIPTVYVNAGIILPGTEPSEVDPSVPTPSWAIQVQEAAAEAVETANAVKAAAESGEFDGDPGVGVPAGGTAGQVLKKASDTSYDTVWGDEEGGSITVDDALSDSSENPVQNKVVKAALDGKGTYSKPSGGIPASDLASAVQTSLDKADSALQSVPSTYRTAEAQDSIDAAQDTAIAGKLSTTGNAYRSASIPMGQLDSTSTATVMTAQVDGITELRDGVCMWLRNGVITSAANFTLNINGLGAKPCYSSLAAASRSTTIFNVNYTMLFVYNEDRVEGGCWDIVYGVDTNTTYTPYSLGFGYGTCTTAADTAAKVASVSSSYKLVAGGIVAIHFSNDVLNNATLNINEKGAKAIYYKGAAIQAGTIKAGDTVTMVYSTYYHVLSIDHALVRLSDATPLVDYGDGDPGMSYAAARADHVHPTDTTRIGYDDQAQMVPMTLSGGNVTLNAGFALIFNVFSTQGKAFFFIPQSQYDYLLFEINRAVGSTQTIYLSSIVGGILYQIVLSPASGGGMSGPLTTIDLNLQNASGVSF